MPLQLHKSGFEESKTISTKFLNSIWNHLFRKNKLFVLYKTFLPEYLNMSHMKEKTQHN